MAIAFHPKFEYIAADVDGDVYIVARDLLRQTAENVGWHDPEPIVSFEGARLEGAVFRHPFLERDSRGILADHVTLEQGVGAVHTAPGHGHEDYVVGRQYGINTFCPVDAAGRFFHAEGADGRLPDELIGKTVWEANPIVLEILKAHGALLATKKLEHSYPHCWRCHKPTIFRATEQWFIGMDRHDLRQKALEAIRRVKWMPAWGEDRIHNMVAGRPDWNISRQRVWGVPIVVFYCDGCREPLCDRKVLDGVVKLFAEHSADIWYERTAAELMPAGTKCAKCGGTEFSKENDILDVWFDSGSSHLAVLGPESPWGLPWPADMYLEGGDQHRGWFHSSLLVSVGLKGTAPYRECATNGWALDGQGRAMSKSLGNVVEPDKIIKQFGADMLRLWVASVEYNEDVRLSDTILARMSEAYRKLRNTFRYALGVLGDFNPATDSLPSDQLLEVDQWILLEAEELVRKCRGWYDEYAFHKVYRAVYDFATVSLSAVYFDVSKDRLYTAAADSRERRSAQTTIHRLNYALVRLFAPLLVFTTEEVWSYMAKPTDAPPSVHIAEFPEPGELTAGIPEAARARQEDWAALMDVRSSVLAALEQARQRKEIGAGLEAKVTLSSNGSVAPLLAQYERELADLFIVSEVALEPGGDQLGVKVDRADGVKCERCWKYRVDVGSRPEIHAAVCGECADEVRWFLS
jgi:isoleucyl-tRNA synthetase